MYITPKKSFSWTSGVCCCCGSMTSSLLSLVTQVTWHLLMLTISCIMLNNTESFINTIVSAIDTNDRLLQKSDFFINIREVVLQNSTLYTAIPIILNVVYLLCNLFAIFGIRIRNKMLLLPWIILYFIKIIFTSSLLIYTVVLLQIEWFRAILSLVIIPIIVLESYFWFIIVKTYSRLRAAQMKSASLITRKEPKPKLKLRSQVSKASDDISTTVGMDELAVSPPHMAWDPEYLIELDPRYGDANPDDVLDVPEESVVEWDTDEDDDEETYYQSDEYTDRGARDDTEFYTESEGEFLEKHVNDDNDDETTCKEDETDFDDVESEHYKTPGIPRPVIRSKSPSLVYTMEGTTMMSSNA